MAQDLEFLNRILADPDNDDLRLSYAARLDAAGDPQGQFIRAQLRLAEFDTEPDAPTRIMHVLDSQAYLKRYGEEWAAPIASLVAEWEFHRGLVAHVTMTVRAFLDRAPQLFALAPIQHLDLKLPAGLTRELFDSPLLARIRSLDLNQGLL